MTSSYFLRGDGGCGSTGYVPPAPVSAPKREPDHDIELTTAGNAALIYRLSGDDNPLHCDPEVAKQAGFDRPILHGLCSFGVATRAILDRYCDNDPARLRLIGLRFSAPVYPGETIRVSCWEQGNDIHFAATVTERNVTVLSQGLATLN